MSARGPVLGAITLDAQVAERHCLPTAALAISLDGVLKVERSRILEQSAFLLPADLPHRGTGTGRHAIVLIDDLSSRGRALVTAHPSVHGEGRWLRTLRRALQSRISELDSPGVLRAVVDDVLQQADRREGWHRRRLDARVEAALEAIDHATRGGDSLPTPLIRAVSGAHLRALFRREVGRTISQHTRARRLLVALAHIERGQSATRAAHSAGFADAAHLSRTTRAAFGMTPRQLKRAAPAR